VQKMTDENKKFLISPDFKAVPKITPPPPAPLARQIKELTAAEALIKYFNDHEWDTSLRQKEIIAVSSARRAMNLSIGDV
jgi:hypothetical protein